MQKIVISNPAMEYFIAKFRNEKTDPYECNVCVDNISVFLAGEISRYLSTEEVNVKTPLGEKNCSIINEEVILVPVLRAGISMMNSFQRILPKSKIGFVWAHRDKNIKPVIDKHKFPKDEHGEYDIKEKTVIILDTMLATAGTMNACAELIYEYSPKQILCASILSTQTGFDHLSDLISVVVTASVSDVLDEHSYVYPGVGDSGDRLYG